MNRSHLAACLGAPQVCPIASAPVFSPPAQEGRCRAAGVLVLAAGLIMAGIMAGIMAAAAPAEAMRGEVPLVVAVDTSRSLTPSDLATIRATITEQLEVLPAGTPVGLVAFNDSAQWLARPGSSSDEVVQALPRLEPAGSYTVLHDALYIAARELGSNGVILLITDGRDERSATTIEDVARLCSGSNVRLVATSLGRSIDERAMRRLALLTDGEYLGRLVEADPGRIAAAVSRVGIRVRQAAQPEASTQARSSPAGSAQPQPQPGDAPPQDASGTQPAAEPGGLERLGIGWLPLLGAALLVIALIAVVVWLMLRRDRDSRRGYDLDSVTPGDRLDQSSDRELDADGLADSLPPELDEVRTAAHTQPVADLAIPDETVLDPAVFDKAPVPPGLDRTMVLDEMPVLIVRQAGRPPRSYTLPRDQVFAVGRAPKVNTLELQEPTVSAQHFKLVPKNDELYVVDLETTNGTSVNQKKVRVKKLAPGDIITAGTVEFEYKLSVKRLS